MPDRPDPSSPDVVAPSDAGYAPLQRAALREVLELSAESVRRTEVPIERRYREEKERTERRFESTTRKIERRFDTLIQRVRKKYEKRVEQLQALSESDSETLESRNSAFRKQVIQQTQAGDREAHGSFNQEIWLADSVVEAVRNQFPKERNELEKTVLAKSKRLDLLEEKVRWVLSEYRFEPPDASVSPDEEVHDDEPSTVVRQRQSEAESCLDQLRALPLPRVLIRAHFWGWTIMLCVLSLGVTIGLAINERVAWSSLPLISSVACIGTLLLALVLGKVLRPVATRRVQAVYVPLTRALATARLALDRYHDLIANRLNQRQAEAVEQRDRETAQAQQKLDSKLAEIGSRRSSLLKQAEEDYDRLRTEIDRRRNDGTREADEERQAREPMLVARRERFLKTARDWYDQETRACEERYRASRSELEKRWKEGIHQIGQLLEATTRLEPWLFRGFDEPEPRESDRAQAVASVIRFGQLHVNLGQLADGVRRLAPFSADESSPITLPAVMTLLKQASLLIQTDRPGRTHAIAALQAAMVRLLTTLPPGRVRFVIVDPVGLGENFAGFMHLSDYDEALAGGRIWTDAGHIEQRLCDLTDHMENVIQKYLRNEFETIDAYNQQAGELAEPYRFLVVADFPVNFNEEALRRLGAIITSGARCGVYTLIAHDIRREPPSTLSLEDMQAASIHVTREDNQFVIQDSVYRQFPLTLDSPPDEERLTELMHKIGRAAQKSNRVEVPFDAITPTPDQLWTRDSAEDLRVPIGRSGATRLQSLHLGRGVAQHALIAGKTGSGKSTLFHVMITNLVSWYSPDEVEFYLIDFKKGVEFKTYATHSLPHARAVAIESDREFGLSVLGRLDQEMERRGELFRRSGVQDIAAYRKSTKRKLPRTLLIVDEFQVFFAEDDKLAQDAAILLDRLVRQGRAFGMHVLLGSQTLGGAGGLARSTIGQMAVRIALQCSEADSQLILNDDNAAARLLSRPGEAIYNDAGGLIEGNSPFQTSWLSDEQRDAQLDRVAELAARQTTERESLIVFEGHAAAELAENRILGRLIDVPGWPVSSAPPQAWLGDAVAIKDPTCAVFRRQSGANLLVVGQRDDAALAMLAASLISLAARHDPKSAGFYIFDGSPVDSPRAGELQRVAAALPHATRIVEWREVPEVLAELAAEVRHRENDDLTDAPAVYAIFNGLQRYRMLRHREDNYGFSLDEGDKPPAPDKLFADIARDGPPYGVHVLAWIDAPSTLERTLDRQTLREFDNRVLFQMSSADSSNLIDTPVANQLGFYRALFCSDEQGILEKFRPYALVGRDWLERTGDKLRSKSQRTDASTGRASGRRRKST